MVTDVISKPLHHVQSFVDYAGEDRVILQFGFGARGGPHYILDPNDDNRVWKSITYDEVHPMGHPLVETNRLRLLIRTTCLMERLLIRILTPTRRRWATLPHQDQRLIG